MYRKRKKLLVAGLIILFITSGALLTKAQRDASTFQGRIAWSADGNFNDEDDWAASPLALAIFAKFGLQNKLVHFDYNCILPKTDTSWEAKHRKAVLGAAGLYGYDLSRFHDCHKNAEEAISSITLAVNSSSADNPLYFVLAGPMEVPYLGISKANPEKRKYVYCISHSRWNDGYASGDLIKVNKRNLIPTGVTWIQITDQNKWLNTSTDGAGAIKMDKSQRKDGDSNWMPWWWMRDSADPNVRFLWDMLQLETRPDASDAGMAYFLMTGDEEAELPKVKRLLEDDVIPAPLPNRKRLRLEAENFTSLNGFSVEYINEPEASHRISLKYSGSSTGEITSEYKELKVTPSNAYHITAHYFSGSYAGTEYQLVVNGKAQGPAWQADSLSRWELRTVKDVPLQLGDKVGIKVKSRKGSGIKLDYLELINVKESNPYTMTPVIPLHDANAMPGQLVIAGKSEKYPGFLAYNGVGPAFLCGPDNPETFLWFGDKFNPDGTVADGGQVEMIQRLADSGVNAFHFQLFRMKKCNYKNEGDDRHAPFNENDPSKGLNEAVLNQWEKWFALLEEKGITLHIEFYNDATDVELMGWKLDPEGGLHPDEHRFIKGIVERFKHHKNILWGLEESANKLDRGHTAHFKKIADLISETDNYNHPIVQSFVVQNDPEGDFHPTSGLPDDYLAYPNIDIVTWLHVVPHEEQYEEQYNEYRRLYDVDHKNFVMMKNETFHHPRSGTASRTYMWSCAMTKMHCLEAYHHASDPKAPLFDDGLIATFMEDTDYQNMEPRNDLKSAGTNWVLANPGKSYIAYSYDCKTGLGLKQMTAGTYKLKWMDTASGATVTQYNVAATWGENVFNKPSSLGKELVLYISNHKME